MGVRARKAEGLVGAISWRKPICDPEWIRRKPPSLDKYGSIFKSLRLR
jgi:hypothetical protein